MALSFKEFNPVSYSTGSDDQINHNSIKRKKMLEAPDMDYATFSKRYDIYNKFEDDASKALKNFLSKHPRGPMGLTPPEVKSSNEFKKLKLDYNKAKIARVKFLKTVDKKYLRQYSHSKRKYNKESVDIDEVLSLAQRRKRGIMMKRMKGRIAIGRKRAMRRTASLDVLKRRANKAARRLIFNKIAKGKDRESISPQRKAEIEKRLDKMKPRIKKIAQRLIPKIRKGEMARRQGRKSDSVGKGVGLPAG